jgi:hypothetical protein
MCERMPQHERQREQADDRKRNGATALDGVEREHASSVPGEASRVCDAFGTKA